MQELEENTTANLSDYLAKVEKLDKTNAFSSIGVHKQGNAFQLQFFSRLIQIDQQDVIDLSGEKLSPMLKTVLCKYLLNCPKQEVKNESKLITFREFSGAGPLFSRFADNTNKTIEQTFSTRMDDLERRCHDIKGEPFNSPSYDLSFKFQALPKIEITLQFNDRDELFPAKAVLLFNDNATDYLDLKSIGSLATYLTGLLINIR